MENIDNKSNNNWCGGVLGLDLGEKRVGVAISRSGIIAEPLETLDFDENFYNHLDTICQDNEIRKIIIGLPRSLSGNNNGQEQKIKKLAQDIEKRLAIKTELIDERFTTKIAKARAGKIDEEAASIILETYLEQKNN